MSHELYLQFMVCIAADHGDDTGDCTAVVEDGQQFEVSMAEIYREILLRHVGHVRYPQDRML